MANLAKYIMIGFSLGLCALTQNLWASEPFKQDALGYTPPSFNELKLSEAEIRWYNYGDFPVVSGESGEKLKKQREETQTKLIKEYGVFILASICLKSPKSWFKTTKGKEEFYGFHEASTGDHALSPAMDLTPFLPIIKFPDGFSIVASEEDVKKKFPSKTSLIHAIAARYQYKEQLNDNRQQAYTARISAVYLATKAELFLNRMRYIKETDGIALSKKEEEEVKRYYNLALGLMPRIFDFSYRAACLGDPKSLKFFYWVFHSQKCNVPQQPYRARLYNPGIIDTWEYFRERLPTRVEYEAQRAKERAALPAPTAPPAPVLKAEEAPSKPKEERRDSEASHSSQSYRDHSSDEEGTGRKNENLKATCEPEEVKEEIEKESTTIDPFDHLATLLRKRSTKK